MKKWHCFEDQAEYNNFLAWAINGSCIVQRMQESSGGVFEIPDYWFYWKQAKNLNSETELDDRTRQLDYRLNRYADAMPGYGNSEYPDYPNE